MSASAIIFYLISAVILGAGILSMTTRKIFRSAIWLLCSLVGIAALYFWLQVEFIAAVQIIVYVGGIVVLVIFSIFLTQQAGHEMARQPAKRIVAAVLAVVSGFALTFLQVLKHPFQPALKPFDVSVARIGSQMISTNAGGYALPFEVASMLLLAAMVACIVIAMKPPSPGNGKTQEQEPEKTNQTKIEITIKESPNA